MPIEKFTLKEPRKYDLPFNGQVFCREEQDGREEWGHVNGVKPVYTTRLNANGRKEVVLAGWTASMTTGFREFRGVLTHTATYQASTDWHPAPAEMQMSPAVREMFLDALKRLATLETGMHPDTSALEQRQREFEAAVVERSETLRKNLDDLLARVDANQTVLAGALGSISRLENPDLPTPAPALAPTPAAPVTGERPRRGATA